MKECQWKLIYRRKEITRNDWPEFWNNVQCTDETQIKFTVMCTSNMFKNDNEAYKWNKALSWVMLAWLSIIRWVLFATSGHRVIDRKTGIVKSADKRGISHQNVLSSVRRLDLCRGSWVLLQDNTSTSIKKWLKRKKYAVLNKLTRKEIWFQSHWETSFSAVICHGSK